MASAQTSLHPDRDRNRAMFNKRPVVSWHPNNIPDTRTVEHSTANTGTSTTIGMKNNSKKNKGGNHNG